MSQFEEVTETEIEEVDRDEHVDENSLTEEEDDDEDEYEDDDALTSLVAQGFQLLVTQDGVPIADVLQGIKESLDKQAKIMYKIASHLEKKS